MAGDMFSHSYFSSKCELEKKTFDKYILEEKNSQ